MHMGCRTGPRGSRAAPSLPRAIFKSDGLIRPMLRFNGKVSRCGGATAADAQAEAPSEGMISSLASTLTAAKITLGIGKGHRASVKAREMAPKPARNGESRRACCGERGPEETLTLRRSRVHSLHVAILPQDWSAAAVSFKTDVAVQGHSQQHEPSCSGIFAFCCRLL